jgi:DNA-binding NtrC family response regulator
MSTPSSSPASSNGLAGILAVDDEEPIRGLLKYYLGPKYDLVTTSSAEEAMEALSSRSFQLVITDIGLPGQTGFDLCESVKQRHPETVIMMITGLFDAQYAKRAIDAGVFSFLTKPIDFKRLMTVVEDALKHQAVLAARRKRAAR